MPSRFSASGVSVTVVRSASLTGFATFAGRSRTLRHAGVRNRLRTSGGDTSSGPAAAKRNRAVMAALLESPGCPRCGRVRQLLDERPPCRSMSRSTASVHCRVVSRTARNEMSPAWKASRAFSTARASDGTTRSCQSASESSAWTSVARASPTSSSTSCRRAAYRRAACSTSASARATLPAFVRKIGMSPERPGPLQHAGGADLLRTENRARARRGATAPTSPAPRQRRRRPPARGGPAACSEPVSRSASAGGGAARRGVSGRGAQIGETTPAPSRTAAARRAITPVVDRAPRPALRPSRRARAPGPHRVSLMSPARSLASVSCAICRPRSAASRATRSRSCACTSAACACRASRAVSRPFWTSDSASWSHCLRAASIRFGRCQKTARAGRRRRVRTASARRETASAASGCATRRPR